MFSFTVESLNCIFFSVWPPHVYFTIQNGCPTALNRVLPLCLNIALFETILRHSKNRDPSLTSPGNFFSFTLLYSSSSHSTPSNAPRDFPGGSVVKNPPAMQEVWVWSLGGEDPLEEGMETDSSILAWEIPWTEEPGRQQSMGSQMSGTCLLRTGILFLLVLQNLQASLLAQTVRNP